MKYGLSVLFVTCLALSLAACGNWLAPQPSPTPSATITLTPTLTATLTATATSTLTPTPIDTPTSTATPTKTPVPPSATPDLDFLFNLSGKPLPYWKGMPVIPQAVAGEDNDDVYYYYLKSSLAVVRQFYLEQMPYWGWQLFSSKTEPNGVTLIFIRNHSTVTVGIVVRNDLVSVMLVDS